MATEYNETCELITVQPWRNGSLGDAQSDSDSGDEDCPKPERSRRVAVVAEREDRKRAVRSYLVAHGRKLSNKHGLEAGLAASLTEGVDFVIYIVENGQHRHELVERVGTALAFTLELDELSDVHDELDNAFSSILECDFSVPGLSEERELGRWKRHWSTKLAPWGALVTCFGSGLPVIPDRAFLQAMDTTFFRRYDHEEFEACVLSRCPYLERAAGGYCLTPLGRFVLECPRPRW